MAICQISQDRRMSGYVILAVALILLILENPAAATSDDVKECVHSKCLKPSEKYDGKCKACDCVTGKWCKEFIRTCETVRQKTMKTTTVAPFIGTCETSTAGRRNVMEDTTVAPPNTSGRHTSSKSGVSLGLAIGLLFGTAIGVIVTSLLCVCVPTLNKKVTTIIMRNRKSRGDGKQETRDLDPQVRHTALRNANDSRDSNIYNVIQLDIPLAGHGPIALGHANSKNPAQSVQAIHSLEYNVMANEIIESSSPSEEPTYQSLNERTMDRAAYNVGSLQLSGNSSNTQNQARAEINISAQIASTADREYLKLEHGGTTVSDMESREQKDGDSSAYFVLEKNSGTSQSSRDQSDVSHSEPTHDYFVLESKQ